MRYNLDSGKLVCRSENKQFAKNNVIRRSVTTKKEFVHGVKVKLN